jgi:hypothetical protein
MSLVGFEPTISVCERAKTVHALNRATTVIGQAKLSFYVLQVLDIQTFSEFIMHLTLLYI